VQHIPDCIKENESRSILEEKMRVTVCELNDDPQAFAGDWESLAGHARAEGSELVLLPEMPFAPWFATTPHYEPAAWQAAVRAHQAWEARLAELAPARVIASRPANLGEKRVNEGFLWDQAGGACPAHQKYYLPDDEGFWEASWYERGNGEFASVLSGEAQIGFLICTELWFMERARAYGKQGVQLLATPRATGKPTVEKWLVGGRAAAVVSGAFSLSSNRFSPTADFGGQGWIIDPDGQVLATTSREQPFVTVSIDLEEAVRAKKTYPRYVPD
jgi:N-carbamoylputrescine amidase